MNMSRDVNVSSAVAADMDARGDTCLLDEWMLDERRVGSAPPLEEKMTVPRPAKKNRLRPERTAHRTSAAQKKRPTV